MKYQLSDQTKTYKGRTLYRIQRLSDGKLGGWIESEANLSQEGRCWIGIHAKVYGNAQVLDNAKISDDAEVFGNAIVSGDTFINQKAQVYGYAQVSDRAQISGRAQIYDDAKVYKSGRVRGNVHVCGTGQVISETLCAWVSGSLTIKNEVIDLTMMHSDYNEKTQIKYQPPTVIKNLIYWLENLNDTHIFKVVGSQDTIKDTIQNMTESDYLCLTYGATILGEIEYENKEFIFRMSGDIDISYSINSPVKLNEIINILIEQLRKLYVPTKNIQLFEEISGDAIYL